MATSPLKIVKDPSFHHIPPQSLEAEEAILCAILLDNGALLEIIEILSPDDFYKSAHQKIYAAILELFTKNEPADAVTLINILRDKGQLEQVGGPAYLASLIDTVPLAVNAPNYAKIIHDKACLRRLINKSQSIVKKCYENSGEVDDVIDYAENAVFEISENKIKPSFFPISKIIEANIDALEERQANKALVTGVPTGFSELDNMTAGFQKSDLIILAARPSMGKCCEASTEIVLNDGSIATIEEIYQRRQLQVLTLNDKWKFHFTQPSDFVDDGKKPVFRVTTRTGRFVETTLTHPFLTVQGWKPLSELCVGNKIAVPRKIDVFGTETMRECEIKLIAYLIGGGTLTGDSPKFTNKNPRILEEFGKVADEFGKDSLVLWLEQVEIKTHEIFIPASVFKLPRDLLALFLNRLFAMDILLKISQFQLGYCSISEKLIRQTQHLLLRFGIIAKITDCTADTQNTVWQLDITDADSIQTFCREINVIGKEEALEKVCAALDKTSDLVQKEVYWDEIVSIEAAGEKQVYDLTIPDTHNFVANDICVHNTALALNIARNAAVDGNVPVAVFSLEMSKEQLSMRLLCAEARVDSFRLRGGFLSREDWSNITDAAGILTESPIYIDDSPNISSMEIRAKARRLKMEHDLGFIIIDYLQLMKSSHSIERRELEIAEISRSLKALAKELNLPVVALSQLNRKVEERSDKRPQLADLRESGSLEQDADVVAFIYRDEVYNKDENNPNKGKAEIIIGKQRNGPIGTASVAFINAYTRFENLAPDIGES
ncbi:MAG: replicative DNA helicase [Desulfobacterales bacterium]|nr:replicative DNA helicase [Desulfobacterales bacterium]